MRCGQDTFLDLIIIQVGVAFYVFLRSWDSTALTFLTIPIFISGVIKYGERTYALIFQVSEEETVIPQDGIKQDDHFLVLAYFLFVRTKFFFAERTLEKDEQKRIYSIIENKSTAEAFKLVAVELGFMYDVLYTKTVIVYSPLGIILRCITFFFSVSSLVIFSTIVDTYVYPITDISISYLLLVGAVLLELYALIILFLSHWAKLWSIKLKQEQHNPISKTLVDLFWRFSGHSQSLLTSSKRWSESMVQYSLIGSCLKDMQPARFKVLKLPFMGKLLERKYLTWIDVNSDDHLQEKILRYLKKLGAELDDEDERQSYLRRNYILRRRGNFALRKRYQFGKLTSEWCTINVEFVDSLIMWHIATDICFYADCDDHDLDCKFSKYLSDYMFYLLIFHPSILPKGISERRFKETRAEIWKIFHQSNQLHDTHSESKACKTLLQNYSDLLQKCQLGKGGELLTHVCLLMAHFGFTKQYVSDEAEGSEMDGMNPEEFTVQILSEEEDTYM